MTDSEHYSLVDKVVMITGGGGGLGSSLADVLVRRGSRVVLVDLDGDAVERVMSGLPAGSALALSGDVTDVASMRAAVHRTVEEFGRLDVAIANAGVLGRCATFRTLTPDEIGRVMAVNGGGVVNTLSAAVEQVIANRGQVAIVSSVFAFANGAGAIPYAMSKAAVAQLGRGLRVELASHGASAMTAYFGLIDTGLIRDGIDAHPDVVGVLDTMPAFLRKRLRPVDAANAIADGLEARAPRILGPKWLGPMMAMQGILNPLIDRRSEREPKLQRALTNLEQHDRPSSPAAVRADAAN